MRPSPEALEDRKLLSKIIRGTDIDGDTWTLRLVGPGDFRVTTQDGTPLSEPSLIQDIILAGGRSTTSRLEGYVRRGPEGDGRVFFQNLETLNNPQVPDSMFLLRLDLNGRGQLSIDIPNFWLGDTSGGSFTPTTGQPTGSIQVPDGTASLRFGGIDTTAFFGTDPAMRIDQNNRDDSFDVDLGLPQYIGTTVIVDRIITTNQAGPNDQTFTDTANFTIGGRLNLFQANEILGDETPPETLPYQGVNVGGTTIVSTVNQNGTTGAIGNILLRGDATNVTVAVVPGNDQGTARIADFFVGGETNKIAVRAPGGIREMAFGKGMDTVAVDTRGIEHLVANRGAVGSFVVSNGPIVLANFGGDVIDSQILSGYFVTTGGFASDLDVGSGGKMTVLVAGDIRDSLFASSVVPDPDGVFDDPDAFLFEQGTILAKYEGTIDNSDLIPFAPNEAFFAVNRTIERGPVVPPAVDEPPYAVLPRNHTGQPGLKLRPGPLGTFRTLNVNPDGLRSFPPPAIQAQRVRRTATPRGPVS